MIIDPDSGGIVGNTRNSNFPTPPVKILNVGEVSVYLRVSRATVYSLIKTVPPLPSFKLKNRRLFCLKEIDIWLSKLG